MDNTIPVWQQWNLPQLQNINQPMDMGMGQVQGQGLSGGGLKKILLGLKAGGDSGDASKVGAISDTAKAMSAGKAGAAVTGVDALEGSAATSTGLGLGHLFSTLLAAL